MPIDLAQVVGADLPEVVGSWGADDVILYHLALGAGVPPTDPKELAYVYEAGLKVLPSFAVIPALAPMWQLFDHPGMDIDLGAILHGEQELEVHTPLPVQAEVTTTATVTGVYDKGRGAVVVVETRTSDRESGRPLFTNRNSIFVRGEGGFGGSSGPKPVVADPQRDPDRVVTCPTLSQQALLYRLTGDKHRLHADPEYAVSAGFDRPILHGLCSFGIACKAAVDTVLDGDVTAVGAYRARFAGSVVPGETIQVALWDDNEKILLSARCVERDTPVLSHAALTRKGC